MNEVVFSTKSPWFRLASVYSNFPERPNEWRQDMVYRDIVNSWGRPKDEVSTYWTEWADNEVLNICHFQWCVIKGLLKIIPFVLIGSGLLAITVVLPLVWLLVWLIHGFADPTDLVQGGLGIWIVGAVMAAIVAQIQNNFFGNLIVKGWRALGFKPKKVVYKAPSKVWVEAEKMYDSLKNKYCVRLKFKDD